MTPELNCSGGYAVQRTVNQHHPVGGHNCVRHAVRVQGNDGGRSDDRKGYHHDLHLLCFL